MHSSSLYAENDVSEKLSSFFKNVTEGLSDKKRAYIVVAHIMNNSLPFLASLAETGRIAAIIPKKKSCNPALAEYIKTEIPFIDVSRDGISESGFVERSIAPLVNKDEKLIIIDIGGYFSRVTNELKKIDNFAGIIEDTDNGEYRYKINTRNKDFPVYSCAASDIKKDFEDKAVGLACVYSGLHLIKDSRVSYNVKTIGCIGTGDVGSAVNTLFSSVENAEYRFWSYDTDKDTNVRFNGVTQGIKDSLLHETDIIFCMSGNKSLVGGDFKKVKNGSFLISCTSRDDEFDIEYLDKHYSSIRIADGLYKYSSADNHFYMVNDGNAPNFLDILGSNEDFLYPFIHATHAAILDCVIKIDSESKDTIEKNAVIKADRNHKIYKMFEENFSEEIYLYPSVSKTYMFDLMIEMGLLSPHNAVNMLPYFGYMIGNELLSPEQYADRYVNSTANPHPII